MSSHDTDDKLVYKANQISTFFTTQTISRHRTRSPSISASSGISRMRRASAAYIDASGTGLIPNSQKAVKALREVPIESNASINLNCCG